MRVIATMTEPEVLEALTREAEQIWGPERAAAQRPALAVTAAAIRRVLQVPLEPQQHEPDAVR